MFFDETHSVDSANPIICWKSNFHLWWTTKNSLETIVFFWGHPPFASHFASSGRFLFGGIRALLRYMAPRTDLGAAGRASETCWNRPEEVSRIADIIGYISDTKNGWYKTGWHWINLLQVLFAIICFDNVYLFVHILASKSDTHSCCMIATSLSWPYCTSNRPKCWLWFAKSNCHEDSK